MTTTFRVGLTGGIGSGKSTVAERFAALGAAVVDTDVIARDLTGPQGAAMSALRAEFGTGIVMPDGALDRPAMRRLAFADSDVRLRLEAILHPMIRQETERRLAEPAFANAPYFILVVPLLVEAGDYRDRVDRVLVVDCSIEAQILRVHGRSGLDRAEILRIMAVQASRRTRLDAADDIIDNEGAPEQLAARVAELDAVYRGLAAKRP